MWLDINFIDILNDSVIKFNGLTKLCFDCRYKNKMKETINIINKCPNLKYSDE